MFGSGSFLTALCVAFCLIGSASGAAGQDGRDVSTVVRRGHNAIIVGMAFSPDGSLLASMDANDVIKVWAMPGRCLVNTIRFSQSLREAGMPEKDFWKRHEAGLGFTSESLLVVQSDSAQARVDPVSGKILSLSTRQNYRLSQDGRVEAYRGQGDTGPMLVAAETSTGRMIRKIPLEKDFTGLALSPDGGQVAVSGEVERASWLRVIETATGKATLDIADAPGEGPKIGLDRPLALSPGGHFLAGNAVSDKEDHSEFRVFATDGWRKVFASREMQGGETFFSPDGKFLAVTTGFLDPRPALVDTGSMRQVTPSGSIPNDSAAFAFSPDSRLLAWGQRPSGSPVYEFYLSFLIGITDVSSGQTTTISPQDHIVRAMALSLDGNMLGLVMETNDGKLGDVNDFSNLTQVYSLLDGGLLWSVRAPMGIIGDAAFMADGRRFVVRDEGNVSVFEIQNGRRSVHIGLPWNFSRKDGVMAISPDNKTVYVDGYSSDGKYDAVIGAFSLDVGRLLRVIPGAHKPIGHLAVSLDGRYVAIEGKEQVVVRDATTGRLKATMPRLKGVPPWPIDASFAPFEFSQDGKSLAFGNSMAKLQGGAFTPIDPTQIVNIRPAIVPTHGVAGALDSARGRLFLARAPDGEIEMWDLRRNVPVLRLYPFLFGGVWLTPDGSFDIAGTVPDVVHFVRGATCASGEEFAARNRPEKIRGILR